MSENCHIVSSKYPPRVHYGYSQAAAFLADLKPNQVDWLVRELPGVSSIQFGIRTKAMPIDYLWTLWTFLSVWPRKTMQIQTRLLGFYLNVYTMTD